MSFSISASENSNHSLADSSITRNYIGTHAWKDWALCAPENRSKERGRFLPDVRTRMDDMGGDVIGFFVVVETNPPRPLPSITSSYGIAKKKIHTHTHTKEPGQA